MIDWIKATVPKKGFAQCGLRRFSMDSTPLEFCTRGHGFATQSRTGLSLGRV
jgi:hypothetical protein